MRCDLHIHSCLSPCGDEDMTPHNIAAMAHIKELDLIALTDHNTARNCPAAARAAAKYGVGFIPGLEVSTSEEVHVVCLFPTVEAALLMDARVYETLPPIRNRPAIFGNQHMMDHEDGILGEEERLLINACGLSLSELPGLVHELGGLVIPAHIHRESGGILPILGAFPPDLDADAFEAQDAGLPGAPDHLRRLKSSDAHYLPDIMEGSDALPLPLAAPTFDALRDYLRSAR